MSFPLWQGVFPAVTTPFKPDLSVDFDALGNQIEWQLANGVHGIILSGSLGEGSTLEDSEKIALVKTALEVTKGNCPVLLCLASSSTLNGCRLAEKAAHAGAAGLMVLPPLNYRSDAAETMAHFRQIAQAANLPIMIYNNPVSYGVDVSPQDLLTMADDPRFVAVKESSDDVRRITDLFNSVGNRYQLFTGVDNLAMESLVMGAHGWVAGLVCAYPRETVAIYNLIQNGCIAEARRIYRWFMPLLHLDVSAKLVQNIKLAQHFVGKGTEIVRPPRQILSGSEREAVMATLKRAQTAAAEIAPLLDLASAKGVNA